MKNIKIVLLLLVEGYEVDDIKYYKDCGADHFSVSSLCFNPILFLKFYWNYVNKF